MDEEIYIVVVTYNGEEYIEKCLTSLINSSIRIQIIIIDNASHDCTIKIVKSKFPHIRIYKLKRNIGFGRANNIGIKYALEAGAQHILLINQDAWIKPDCLSKLVYMQKKYPEYGILSPLHLNKSQKHLDIHFAQLIADSRDIVVLLSDLLLKNKKQNVYSIQFVNAAVWLISRKCIKRVGLFNPVFSHYAEDMEYIERIHYFGFKVGIITNTYAIHEREQFSFKGISIIESGFVQRNQAIIIYRLSRIFHSNFKNLVSVISWVLFLTFPKNKNILEKFIIKLKLIFFIFSKLAVILKNKRIVQLGSSYFFKNTALDIKKYLKKYGIID